MLPGKLAAAPLRTSAAKCRAANGASGPAAPLRPPEHPAAPAPDLPFIDNRLRHCIGPQVECNALKRPRRHPLRHLRRCRPLRQTDWARSGHGRMLPPCRAPPLGCSATTPSQGHASFIFTQTKSGRRTSKLGAPPPSHPGESGDRAKMNGVGCPSCGSARAPQIRTRSFQSAPSSRA